ncbi:NADPH-dependent F420 reductase [Geodermatophilus sp. SYSU D01176]
MPIAVIGAGNVGGGLARAAVAAGHDVVLSGANPDRARATAEATGARAAESNVAAVDGAQVVVPAVPGVAAPAVAAELAPALDGAVVVDATNPLDEAYLQVLLAGDDADAKARVAELASSLGFAPIDAGGLRLARSLEEIALLNITLNATKGWAWQSAFQLVGPTA